ncbi:hypothetical protein FSARC_3521 [Fusarium sarcochroum]|uniref:F-box domain-containing protein n=1 Tax=Fusarium sarcochroum TaxID=1208366 RepID=A0A8H4U4B2_9HYPO|nr:hypothetical protein FSARC_3521 [Fusarium sarcochroum]
MASTIGVLPAEIVDQILQDVDRSEKSRSTITSCLLVNRRWRDLALSILYRDLVLFCDDRTDRFLACHDGRGVSSNTLSLTILLSHPDPIGFDTYKQLNTQTLQLARDVIPRMRKLKSFALARDHRDFNLSLLRSTISTILEALPASCTSLELAAGGGDGDAMIVGPFSHPLHLCEDIRRVLPRMHHVLINLGHVCDAMLGTWDSDQIFHPIGLPHIRSLQVDCLDVYASEECTNGHHQDTSETLWHWIIRGLQHVVNLRETATANITVLGSSPGDYLLEQDIYWTLLRCHIRKGGNNTTTWAFPVAHIPPPNHGNSITARLIRMDDGDYVTFDSKQLPYIAGGRPWTMLTTGSKLPVGGDHYLARVSDEELGILTWAEWKAIYPKKKGNLVANEQLTGMRLIDAEERKGFELRSLVERTPKGYVRPAGEGWHRTRLLREGDPELEAL